MDFRSSPDYLGWREINLNSCLIAISTLAFGFRIYARAFMSGKTLGLDDAVASVAYVLIVVQSSLDIYAVPFGSGAHLALLSKAQLRNFFEAHSQNLAIMQLVYFWAIGMVRFAIMAFIPRICSDIMLALYGLALANFANTAWSCIFRLVECTPVADNFKNPTTPRINCVSNDTHRHVNWAHAIVGLLIDIPLMILPVWIVYCKMLWSKKMINVVLVFGFGIFAVVTGLVRIVLMLTFDFTTDITHKMGIVAIWTDLESHVGLWCSCFPAISCIIRALSDKLGYSTTATTQQTGRDSRGYTEWSSGGRGHLHTAKDGYVMNGIGVDEDSDSQRAVVERSGGSELEDLQQGSIYKRVETNVNTEFVASA
ncbi:uncharacterized protein BCR38DRAFT_490913 [Pseudomassariella vexata]|uniref:Rhodopsin domain-containing protein n=1 Tax=Pseudomassariella vexata TaxID=1141098 RepID=A0A1Y2D9M0_9PEZI|nr:uncharacterized protein BCR38DRAFT_490913 [Pseudomassariella vexata]ORY55907.1 hypothetical protein BCR38DRAFT_490913 [Pseudomassariella vexata]